MSWKKIEDVLPAPGITFAWRTATNRGVARLHKVYYRGNGSVSGAYAENGSQFFEWCTLHEFAEMDHD